MIPPFKTAMLVDQDRIHGTCDGENRPGIGWNKNGIRFFYEHTFIVVSSTIRNT
jgi:hypothetical protein